MIAEVKKIEKEALDLEKHYEDKLLEMDRSTDSKIIEMKETIEADLKHYKEEQQRNREEKIAFMKESLLTETEAEKNALSLASEKKHDKLVDIVIEEVIKQYGNS